MITFTELLERAKTEKIAIHTPTEAQAKALLKALDEKGYKWNSEEKLTTKTRYGVFREDTCYDFGLDKEVWYWSLELYRDEGYPIIEFDDIDLED